MYSDFSMWFIDYIQIANGFKLFVCCCYLVFTIADLASVLKASWLSAFG